MARKTATVTIDADTRDKGKTFFLTEMPATDGEAWATRALFAIGRSGIDVPEEILSAGMAGVAMVGVSNLLRASFDEARPLLDEMMGCVQIVPDPRNPMIRRGLVEAGPDGEGADIEEISTRLRLRSEVVALHVGFSIHEKLSELGAMAKTFRPESSNIPIAPAPSEPSSPPDSPA